MSAGIIEFFDQKLNTNTKAVDNLKNSIALIAVLVTRFKIERKIFWMTKRWYFLHRL